MTTFIQSQNICQTCLSAERLLYPIKNLTTTLQFINLYIKVDEVGGICFECKAVIMRFSNFKTQVFKAQDAMDHMIQFEEIKCLSSLNCYKNHIFDYEYQHYGDPLLNVKGGNKCDINCKEDGLVDCFDDDKIPDISNEIIDDYEEKNYEEATCLKNITSNVLDSKLINEVCDIKFTKTNFKNETIRNKKLFKRRKCSGIGKRSKAIRNINTIDNFENEVEIKDKFTTVVFTEKEMLKNREEKQNQPNFKKLPYKCDSCVLGFTRKETYDLHMEKRHDESNGLYKCDVCESRFGTLKSMERHRSKHYVLYRCHLCKYETLELWSAVNHCRTKHSGDSSGRIHCQQCPTVVGSPEDLDVHIQTQHTLYCNECGEKFKGKHTLRTHKIRIHAVKREFVCDICGKTFKTKMRLESHMVSHNTALAKKLAFCAICNVQYKNIYVYRNHLKNSANHSERAYHCVDCDKKFASKVYWQKHRDFYHLQKSQFKCEICNKLFISDWRLKNHRQTHHGLSRSRNHACNVCTKKFFTLSTLRGHQLTHSEQRSYMCEDCGDTFKQRPALYTHYRLVHKGVKRKK